MFLHGLKSPLSSTALRALRAQMMDALTAFGLFAVTAMLVFYALEDRSPWFILAFAGACALGSVYGFLQGAWPFGVIEAIWAGVAVWRWVRQTNPDSVCRPVMANCHIKVAQSHEIGAAERRAG